jgi:tetratricopeptide (TPR) repeat protein
MPRAGLFVLVAALCLGTVAAAQEGRPPLSAPLGMGSAAPECESVDRRKRRQAIRWLNNGLRAYKKGEFTEAGRYWEYALRLGKEACCREVESKALLNLGAVAHEAGNPDRAYRYFARARAFFEKLDDKEGQAAALSNLAVIDRVRGNLAEAENAYRRALQLAGSRTNWADYAGNLANLLLLRGDVDAAEQLYRQVLAESKNYALGRSRAYFGLGRVSSDRGNLDSADNLYQLGLKHLKRRPSSVLVVGVNALLRGDLETAEAHLRGSLAIAEETGDAGHQGIALDYLGELARMRGDLAAAEDFHRRAGASYQKSENRSGQAEVLGNLGAVALERKDYARAVELLRQALTIHEEMGAENSTVAQFEVWHGRALQAQAQTEPACAAWERARNIYHRYRNAPLQAEVERLMQDAPCPRD